MVITNFLRENTMIQKLRTG